MSTARTRSDDGIREIGATRHSIVAGRLDWHHRDPFDRILAAQSIAESMTLVTGRSRVPALGGVDVLWD